MRKFEAKIDNHDRAFGTGEEIRFAVSKLKEILDAGSIETTGDIPTSTEVSLETDNYIIDVRLKDNKE